MSDRAKIQLYPVQKTFRESDALYRGFVGGRGTGKTHIGSYDLLRRAQPNRLYGLYAPTYRMMMDASLRSLLDMGQRLRFVRNYRKADMVVELGNGAEILCRSLDDPERARGPNLSGAWIDEASLTPKASYDIIIAALREQGEQGWLSATFTPKGRRHWTYEVFGQATPNTALFKARTYDNPFLPSGFAATLAQQYTGQFARQELEGEFIAFEGLVYEEFVREVHVQRRPRSEFVRYIVGCDEGYTNPAVALVIGIDSDDRAHVCEEIYTSRMLQDEFVRQCQRMGEEYAPDMFVVDPSAAGLIAAMRKVGLLVRNAYNAVNDGIQVVKARLRVQDDGRPRLTVDPACVNTIAEFESYIWAQDRAGTTKDAPAKESDHAMDALRYSMMQLVKRKATARSFQG